MGGAGPLGELAIFREYIERLKPKMVVWIYTETDIMRIPAETYFLKYLNRGYRQGLMDLKPEIDKQFLKRLEMVGNRRISGNNKWIRFLTLMTVRDRILANLEYKKMSRDAQYDMFREVLQMMDSTAAEWNGRFIFVFLHLPNIPREEFLGDHDRIIEIVRKSDVPLLDLYDVMEGQKDIYNLYHFGKLGHFNEKGYKIMADAIAAYLESFEKKGK